MNSELQVAVQFVCSYLYNKLPRRRIDGFGFELEKALDQKFQGHWYPSRPTKGSAYRCLKFQSSRLDPAVDIASRKSGLKVEEILANLPNDLMVWIDPREVSYRIGEKGSTQILYSDHHPDEGIDNAAADNEVASHADSSRFAFNPDAATFKPIDSLASSMNNLSLGLSPVSSTLSPVSPTSSFGTSPSPTTMLLSRPNTSPTSDYIRAPQKSQHLFTAAMFAQTKFGSTKLKNSGKRSNFPPRQSPTEVGAYFKQRNGLNNGTAYPRVPNNFTSQRDWLPPMPRHDNTYNCWADPFFPRVEEIPSYGYETRPIAPSVKPNRVFYDAMNFQGSFNGRYGQHPLVAAN
ncbi:protein Tob2-like [Anneissia japonica]|uniref:protein Tob2-like n=1 Tax=Anneissia japonica TaxID=1529436 RepID=UPI0014254FF2|nr:protein Tob2-like [Anneissia japonica]